MEVSQELQKAKDILNNEREIAYRSALQGNIEIEVSAGKSVIINGGLDNLWSNQTAFESLFIDPDVPEVEANIKQADSTLIKCTKAEWVVMLKYMRNFGKNLFIKNEVVISHIAALTIDNTMAEVWNTTWENITTPIE